MKKTILTIAAIMLLGSIAGCSNGPILSHFRNGCKNGCQAPPATPSYGYPAGDCATGNCAGPGGQIISSGQATSYMNDSYGVSDPYINGSNYDGATINPPVFDSYSTPGYGSTIVPPASSGTLPTPSIGN
jgi:hypothetical protein